MKRINNIPILFLCFFISVLTIRCTSDPQNLIQPSNDTTSHVFSIVRIDTLGSIFSKINGSDVHSETNIWVAGLFTNIDTKGEITYPYNLAHWDGYKWDMIAVPMKGWNNTGPHIAELGSVKAFSDSQIIVIAKHDNSIAWWNGSLWFSNYVDNAFISSTSWYNSSDEIYCAGSNARASYFNGSNFSNINTGLSTVTFTDIWGDNSNVYTVGYSNSQSSTSVTAFLSIQGISSQINNLYDYTNHESNPPFPFQNIGPIFSVFRANSQSKLWVLAGKSNYPQLFEIQTLFPFQAHNIFDLPSSFGAYLIRGTADSDLYIVSQNNSVFYHYNGSSWFKYCPPIVNFILSFTNSSFAVDNNIWVSTGYVSDSGLDRVLIIVGEHH